MKHLSEQPVTMLSVWGFNIAGLLADSLPYLQFISLVLAISMSIISIKKMVGEKKKSK